MDKYLHINKEQHVVTTILLNKDKESKQRIFISIDSDLYNLIKSKSTTENVVDFIELILRENIKDK